MKDPKKVAQGKRLVEWNHMNEKEELAQKAKVQPDEVKESKSNLSYSVGAVIVVGMLDLLGYYVCQRGSPGGNNDIKVTPVETRANKFEMD